jgi:hypothetical protein
MFPEVEGYTAAVPSKRDLLTLVKAIQDEVVTVVLEGDRSLVKLVGREALKAVQLLLTKVENMAGVGESSVRVVLCCIVLYCIVLYCIVLYCIVLYCIVLYCTVLYCIVLYCIVLYCIVLCCVVVWCGVLCCVVMWCGGSL